MRNWIKGALLGAAAASAAVVYASRVERGQVTLDRYTIDIAHPGLPGKGLTILHLSDLHCRPDDRVLEIKLAQLGALIEGAAYDIAVITGDTIDKVEGLPIALAFLARLRPNLGAFVCPGNRDYRESSLGVLIKDPAKRDLPWSMRDLPGAIWRLMGFGRKLLHNERFDLQFRSNDVPTMLESLREIGVQPLVNQAVRLPLNSSEIWLAGTDDFLRGEPDLDAALAGIPEHAVVILLTHNPEIWLDPRVDRATLMLSGHTHGGQIRLPVLGAVHTQGTHLTRSQPAGWFRRGDARLFVSRGIGESLPFRLGARPQAALIHLVPTRGRDTSA